MASCTRVFSYFVLFVVSLCLVGPVLHCPHLIGEVDFNWLLCFWLVCNSWFTNKKKSIGLDKRGYQVNIFGISPRKYMLWPRRFYEYPQCMFSWRNKKKYQHFWIEKSILSRAMSRLGGSVGCAVRLEIRRSRVHTPPRSATFFRRDWSWNIFYGHSLPSADSRRAVVSFWRKNVHNTG